MQQRLILSMLCGLLGSTTLAQAAPLYLGKSDAVAPPRRDPGTGICGSAVKFINQPTPVGTIDEATLLLNRLMGDPNLVGRAARLFQTMNLSIGAGSEADFRASAFPDEIFPYCTDPQSMPMGLNDNNIAVRIRGYLNVPTATAQPMTLALNCDDGCIMRLGTSRQVVTLADERSPQLTGRRARSVVFQDPGLYPLEVVYYQNATSGYLEASRANTMTFVGDDIAVSNTEWSQQAANFKPLGSADLYSAITGSVSECRECGDLDATCASGSYCGDGLCQPCNQPAHCGPSCMACPSGTNACSAGKCIQCSADEMCSPGGRCDMATGMCQAPMGCVATTDCKGAEVCRPEGFCGAPPKQCTDVTQCDGSQRCLCEDLAESCAQKVCRQAPIPCTTNTQCPESYTCDSAAQTCKVTYRLYGGGLAACSISRGAPPSSHGLGLLALFGLALFGLRSRARRSDRQPIC